MSIWSPLNWLADWLTYNLLHIGKGTLFGSAVNFFIFDSIKIFILISVIIFVVSIVRSFLPPEKIRKVLSHKYQFTGNILAALFGIGGMDQVTAGADSQVTPDRTGCRLARIGSADQHADGLHAFVAFPSH